MSSDLGHDHLGFELPAGSDPLGRPIDEALLGSFIAAAFDGCQSCQDRLITAVAADAPMMSRLVELACVAAQSVLGGLPANLTDLWAPGAASTEFRLLAAAGLDGANHLMWDRCSAMSMNQRRAAADTAADLLIGYLETSG